MKVERENDIDNFVPSKPENDVDTFFFPLSPPYRWGHLSPAEDVCTANVIKVAKMRQRCAIHIIHLTFRETFVNKKRGGRIDFQSNDIKFVGSKAINVSPILAT